jgi:hypothetical protein
MRRLSFIILAFLLFLPAASKAKDLPKIAVWDLAPREIKGTYAQELTSILVSEIAKMKKYEVYSQENVRTLAGWTEERMKLGCSGAQCLTALGQMDIAKLISGSVGKIGNRYSVSLNLFDTQNSKAENAVSEFARSEDDLIELVQVATRKLLGVESAKMPRILFEEHFLDNKNNWLIEETKGYKFEINQGKYILESKNGGAWLSTRPVPLDQKADFKIDLAVHKISGTDEYGYGLVWGGKDLNNYYVFLIWGKGSYSFQKFSNGTQTRIFEAVGPMVNKFNSANKLSLKKTENSLEFFINDRLVDQSPFAPFLGNYIGCIIFSGPHKIKVAFSDLIVAQY